MPKGSTQLSNLSPNTNSPFKNEKFMPGGPLDQAIYIQTQTSHSRIRNLRQRDHSTEQFMLKHKQTTQKWAFITKTLLGSKDSGFMYLES